MSQYYQQPVVTLLCFDSDIREVQGEWWSQSSRSSPVPTYFSLQLHVVYLAAVLTCRHMLVISELGRGQGLLEVLASQGTTSSTR